MKYKKIILLAILFACILALSPISAADNATDDFISIDDDAASISEDALESSNCDALEVESDSDDLTYAEDDYENVYVNSVNGYYGNNNVIKYGWTGNLNGYFEIHKANSVVYQKTLSPDGKTGHDFTYSGLAIKAVGTYKAIIYDEYGDILSQATVKINKMPTRVISPSFSTKIGAIDYVYAGISDKKLEKIYETAGKAKFSIAGKTYSAKFKKGIAQIKVKFPLKAKTYKCSVKFLGNKNYKASSFKFKIKVSKYKTAILNKNRKVKIGKYTVKFTQKQYKAIVQALKKNKSKVLKFKTGYTYKVKVPYTKQVRNYKTTKAVKTWYAGSYLPMIQKMRANGWTKVSEYTYNQPNPKNKYGIGLSSYTIAVCKWVKVTYKTAYKTKYYPVNAYVSYKKSTIIPYIELYAHGRTLNWKYMAIA